MSDTQKNFYKKLLGSVGEKTAVKFLKKKKYKILKTNQVTPFGEIDIIAKNGEYLVFLEVKARKDERFGTPREAVTEQKQRHIKNSAKFYIQKENLFDEKIRFDVIEVFLENGEVNHIENAF